MRGIRENSPGAAIERKARGSRRHGRAPDSPNPDRLPLRKPSMDSWRLSRAAGWIMMLMRWKGGWKGTCCVISRRGAWRGGQGKTRRGLWEEEQNPDRIGAWTDSSRPRVRAARLGGNLVQRRRWPSPDWWRALGVRDVRTIEESRRAGCSQGSRGEGGIERELKPELSR